MVAQKDSGKFGLQSLALSPGTTRQIIGKIAEAVVETAGRIPCYQKEHPEFEAVGNRMLSIWQKGVDQFARGEKV